VSFGEQRIVRSLIVTGALLAAGLAVAVALADPVPTVVVGKGSAAGPKAHAVAVVRVDKGSFTQLTIEVTAKPSQRVSVGYLSTCVSDRRYWGGRESKEKSGRAPVSLVIELDDFEYADYCRITADATLAKKGRVSLRVLGRR
jgi:hypothetical protein